jgi:nitroreductase
MNILDIIKTRKSVRTFDGNKISDEDKNKLLSYSQTIENPYDIPVNFVFLYSEKFNLNSSVIEGEDFYIAAKVPKTPHCVEAYGYSFEKLVLYAWSLGIGTTWIGGTFDRNLFEKAASTQEDEYMMIVTPVGYLQINSQK